MSVELYRRYVADWLLTLARFPISDEYRHQIVKFVVYATGSPARTSNIIYNAKMPPDPLLDEEEQYASSEDSDFAPDDVLDQASDQSDIEDEKDEDNKATNKRNRPAVDEDAADAGYDNSGDEAIIKRGEKRRKKTEAKGVHEDEEGGEGGLIKTRRQRAAE